MKELNIDQRIEICNSCPIYNPTSGQCNPKLYLNPDTNDVSTHPKTGYVRGCGCYIKVKIRNIHNHCIAGKW